jgi:carbon storage regulator CsrA
MLVLSARLHEKIQFPGLHTYIQILGIQSSLVRLGIDAPEEVRVLRQGIPDRAIEWGPDPDQANEPLSLLRLSQLLDRRLAVAQVGLAVLLEHLDAGELDQAQVIREKLDEDLHLLRRRVRCEMEKVCPSSEAQPVLEFV